MILLIQKMSSFFINNTTPNFTFIKPSGNHVDAERFKELILGDIVEEKNS